MQLRTSIEWQQQGTTFFMVDKWGQLRGEGMEHAHGYEGDERAAESFQSITCLPPSSVCLLERYGKQFRHISGSDISNCNKWPKKFDKNRIEHPPSSPWGCVPNVSSTEVSMGTLKMREWNMQEWKMRH